MVYFVHAIGLKRIKIGKTRSASSLACRLSAIQSDCPVRIKVLVTLLGFREAHVHALFAKYRLTGEWFYFADPIKQFIADVTTATHRADITAAIERARAVIAIDPKAEIIAHRWTNRSLKKDRARARKAAATRARKRQTRLHIQPSKEEENP